MIQKRLEELKEKLIKYKGICNYALETGEDDLILALLDTAMPADAEVERAIGKLQIHVEICERSIRDIKNGTVKFTRGTENINDEMSASYAMDIEGYRLAIASLRAFRRPTAEEVAEIDRAIDILTKGREQFSYRAINAFDGALDLAITALKRMKGCE